MRLSRLLGLAAVTLGMVGGGARSMTEQASPGAARRETCRKAYENRNYKDAFEGYRRLALDPADDPAQVEHDLDMAVACLMQLNRVPEIDALRETVVKVHEKNWRLLWAAARSYVQLPHHGFMIAGKFERGDHRGGGAVYNATQRDRVRALQLMRQAMPLALEDPDRTAAGSFLLSFAGILLEGRGYDAAWQLQTLTDIDTLPDHEPGWGGYQDPPAGAPVGPDDQPIYHGVPKSFADAANDGERWRWCLAQAMEVDAKRRDVVRLQFADFLRGQFDVQTIAQYGGFFGRAGDDAADTGTYALHTLGEDETIARLAIGLKRFKLPEEFNFIKIYQDLAADRKAQGGVGLTAMERLVELFENRRQYPRAAEYCQKVVAAYREAVNDDAANGWQARLDQIVGNWGQFETVLTQPAGGRGAAVDFVFRNGRKATFTAREIRVEKLLDDVKAYLKSRPAQLDHAKINLENIGYRLVCENQSQYVGRQVAAWEMDLEPREKHFDKRVTVTTPLSKAGAYLLTAKMADGNTSSIVVWLDDTAIVKKQLSQRTLYFVADATTGKPLARANVEFLGYRQRNVAGQPRWEIDVLQFAVHADAQGQVMPEERDQPNGFFWLATARTGEGRFGFLGFDHVWHNRLRELDYRAVKVFTITDRPVYRPKQKVQYKFWVGQAQYDMPDKSAFAGQEFNLDIFNPKGEKIVEKTYTADQYGGMADELELPEDAALGVYRFAVKTGSRPLGGGTFRVEEYKKPEFEVSVDAPSEPVMLGEKIAATVRAKYYFGSPVTQGTVKYKVTRASHVERWYPIRPWDWLYGPGYWWFAPDYAWYPGWWKWGCPRPMPMWWHGPSMPPEVVAQREVPLGEDGTVKIDIDTTLAKEIHPDQDHGYTITAEVVDQSRRTIVGTGSVLVARAPFKVHAWVDRGYYRVGETIRASFLAQTLDHKPVAGQGGLTLLKITYADGKPVETPVQTWDLPTNDQGRAELRIKASQAGQYRLAYKVVDAKEHEIEGGYLFTIRGEGFDGSDFRFNHVELVPDRPEYKPGESVQLQVNTDRAGSTVLLFLRPTNGVYLPPKVVHLDGKSTVVDVAVAQKDMPNFFVEALTVADGRVHTDVREIVVPPEKRVLNVEVTPSSETYKPGAKAKVNVRLTDFSGQPFVGSTVIAIYDKSVEYISGGSNVPEIKAFFWKWRRQHHERTETNLTRQFFIVVAPNTATMTALGMFGGTVADELSDAAGGHMVQSARNRFGMRQTLDGPGGGMGMAGAYGEGMARGRVAKAAPMPAMALAAGAPAETAAAMPGATDSAAPPPGEPGGEMVEPTLRTQFADTALWVAQLTTQSDGTAEVELDMPENLTTWRIKVWGMGAGTRVGEGQADVITRKDLILRMQAPRFFVQTDEVVLSANVHNYLKTKKDVRVALELDGKCLVVDDSLGPRERTVAIEPNGEARIDWRVNVNDEGEAVVRMKALTDEESDAMEMRFPCHVHGMLKTESYSGAIRPDDASGKFTVNVPKDRRPDETRLEIRYSPTLAGAMVDALPYLVEYPYGCTEQTLNRFLPTVITQRILIEKGIDLEDVRTKRTNLNAQEIGDDSQRAEGWKRYDRNPIFDRAEVDRMVKDGVKRLTEMQVSDGGWGWFSGWGERSYPHTTAYVVHGLQIAQRNDVALVPGVLERGVAWLTHYQDEQVQRLENAKFDPKKKPWKDHADNLDAFVHMVLVDAGVENAEMLEFLYRDRTHLSVYGLAMYGMALEKQGERDKLAMVLRNIGQYVVEDDENQTAWLNLPADRWWWCWHENEFEAQAYYLKLLARTDPKGPLAPQLVKYLLNNRKHATYWDSTRDTALCVEAMADFLRASGEDKPEMTIQVWIDGQLEKAVEITPANLFSFDNAVVVEGAKLADGPHAIEIKRAGRGPVYYNAYMTNFTLEDFIARAGLEIKVDRKYYRLRPVEATVKASGSRGQAVDQKIEKYEREELPNLAAVTSGDLVEIELVLESKNDYEYLVFEDMKPAGFEPVDVRSGYNGNALGAYMEFRDNRVVFFVRALARGRHGVAYRMRAEIPGRFSALPTRASAMYAPELKANSDEIKLHVEDKAPTAAAPTEEG
ncbi:MAG: alpha-2-macroglobulin [Pirellulales bacterium]|nr:alpha-2-macroglobulin [Pirellulales bacterium]